jgi:hypothetical protein
MLEDLPCANSIIDDWIPLFYFLSVVLIILKLVNAKATWFESQKSLDYDVEPRSQLIHSTV